MKQGFGDGIHVFLAMESSTSSFPFTLGITRLRKMSLQLQGNSSDGPPFLRLAVDQGSLPMGLVVVHMLGLSSMAMQLAKLGQRGMMLGRFCLMSMRMSIQPL